jgi:hypothetical protein
VIEMLVLLLLDLLVGVPEGLRLISFECLRRNLDQLPVEMVLGLRLHNALAGDELGGLRGPALERHFHCFDE